MWQAGKISIGSYEELLHSMAQFLCVELTGVPGKFKIPVDEYRSFYIDTSKECFSFKPGQVAGFSDPEELLRIFMKEMASEVSHLEGLSELKAVFDEDFCMGAPRVLGR